jgi:NADP-dependent aldehyde dehydrogenase
MTTPFSGTSLIGSTRGTGTAFAGRAIVAATGEALPPDYFAATPDEVETALQLAGRAFPAFSALPGRTRAGFLRQIAVEIEAIADDIAARGGLETALPEARLRGETGRTTGQLRLFASLLEEGSWVDARIEHALPDRQPLPKPDLRSMLRPLGPVAVFCAGNFPLAYSVAGGDTASALFRQPFKTETATPQGNNHPARCAYHGRLSDSAPGPCPVSAIETAKPQGNNHPARW